MAFSLHEIPLFSSLSTEEIETLEQTFPGLEIPSGMVIVEEGESDDRFYILMDGKVEVIKALGKKNERFLHTCDAGTLIGEMSLFSGNNRHTASVRALTHLRLLQVTRSDLDSLLHHHPQLAYEIISLLSRRLEESENLTIRDLREKNHQLQEAYDELKAAQDQLIEKE